MNSQIVPLAESHFDALREVLDAVAREKRFLALIQAPPRDEAFSFYRNIVENDHPHYVALLDKAVVGWCDILPGFGEARRHLGVLGIGKAWAKGLTRIELSVRTDNHNARTLYERMGFQHEGVKRRAFFVDGQYFDSYAMALLCEDAANVRRPDGS